jgi:hypothetical protein
VACGHRLIAVGETFPTAEEALRIGQLGVSQVAYVELTAEEPELWVTFDVVEPIDLSVSLGLPQLDRLSGYRPRIAVLNADGEEIAVFDSSSVRIPVSFYEPFTGTKSWILIEESISLVAPGTYFIAASAPPELADKLWLTVGRREAFGLNDILSFPSTIRQVRAFHEVGPRGPTPLEWATLLGFAVLGLVVVLAATRGVE